jgi:hypothetical protein
LGDSVKNKFEKNYDSLTIFYSSILKHYNVSYEEFQDAMDWYKAHPVVIDSLYNKVINQISETKAKEQIKDVVPIDPSRPDTINKKDSLKNVKDSILSKKKIAPATKDTIAPKKVNPNKKEI